MEKREYKFDIDFLKAQVEITEKLISDTNINLSEKNKLIEMKKYFEIFTKEQSSQTAANNQNEIEIDIKLCKQLEDKFNEDLDKLPIECWNEMKQVYQNADNFKFSQIEHHDLLLSIESVIEIILTLYRHLDDEYYKSALKIIQNSTSLINFNNSSLAPDQCFCCSILKAPFINIKKSDDDGKYTRFIHELQHGIDWLINNYKMYLIFSETAPIFFETILTDILYQLSPCEGLYNFRINDHICITEWINAYTDSLLLFKQYGNKITTNNINMILNADIEEYLKYKCRKFGSIDFLSYYNYAISFLKAIELREKYYQKNKKEAVLELKNFVSGKGIDVNFSKLLESYNRYIKEIKGKQRSYQKTVK